MLFLSADVQAFIFRYHIVWRAFQFVIPLCGYCLSQLFLKLSFSFSYLILHLLVFLLSFLILFYFHLQNGLTGFKIALCFIFFLAITWVLLLLDNFLYLLKFILNIWGKFAHFERWDSVGFINSFDIKLIELKTVDEVIL